MRLTARQWELLEAVERGEIRSYGTQVYSSATGSGCTGTHRVLRERGLVRVASPDGGLHSRSVLTEAGRAALAERRRTLNP